MPRTFIGWPLPESVKLQIEGITSRLKGDLPRASWTRPETYHITFAFLGEQEEQTIDRIGAALIETVISSSAVDASIGEPGFFPSARRPRVGWLDLADGERVVDLANMVRDMLTDQRIEYDAKPFRPHLTLVRPKSRWHRPDVERFMSALEVLRGTPLLVDSVVLFESRLGSGGARHIPRVVARCENRQEA